MDLVTILLFIVGFVLGFFTGRITTPLNGTGSSKTPTGRQRDTTETDIT